MTNHSEEQENSRLSRSRASVCFLIAALGYILIATSLLLFIFAIFALFTENSNSAIRNATTATVMLIFGMILVLLARIHLKRGSKTSAVQVVISTIPAEDLTNSGPYTFVLDITLCIVMKDNTRTLNRTLTPEVIKSHFIVM